ncbi:MAG: hypothetical protein CM1200mP2_35650 [Planctomycetaceae bacterium]|nr:MAG: hypothetical protein CM1200mP2_35650 [Planctomycetaceae bacterium]
MQAGRRTDDDEEFPEDPPGRRSRKEPGWVGRPLQANRRRPGEQETLKSPLVLFLGGSAFVLLIASATFWFMFSRNTIKGLVRDCIGRGRGRELFAGDHSPGGISSGVSQQRRILTRATFLLNQARVEARLGGSKEWEEALAAIEVFRKECQDLETYDPEKKIYLFNKMVEIAIGCADEGGESLRDTEKGRELLELSGEAGRKLSLYKTDDEKFDSDQAPGRTGSKAGRREAAPAGGSRWRTCHDHGGTRGKEADGRVDRAAETADAIQGIRHCECAGTGTPESTHSRTIPGHLRQVGQVPGCGGLETVRHRLAFVDTQHQGPHRREVGRANGVRCRS